MSNYWLDKDNEPSILDRVSVRRLNFHIREQIAKILAGTTDNLSMSRPGTATLRIYYFLDDLKDRKALYDFELIKSKNVFLVKWMPFFGVEYIEMTFAIEENG